MLNYYNDFFEIGQQQFKLYLYESCIPHDDSVFTLKKVMEMFKNPKFAGEIKNADAVGEVGNVTCGDIMKVFLKIK